MVDSIWLLNRLKAMSIQEVIWRIQQKLLERKEKRQYGGRSEIPIDCVPFRHLPTLAIEKLFLNLRNSNFSSDRVIKLLGEYDYEKYRTAWAAGFQTATQWPNLFSAELLYKQRDDIGDARTNWELNRHYQFALLAKNYRTTGEKAYLDELIELFDDWNEKSPFLHGISWTSVMEVAIRINSWVFVCAFLGDMPDVPERLNQQLRIGIRVMVAYVASHHSRYSSANNHLIVEAYALGLVGILSGDDVLRNKAIQILTHEIEEQNYPDGVNKELSLHYQTFFMEAVGLLVRLMQKNDIVVPTSWIHMLVKMSRYVKDCMGEYGEVVEFGDNDEGKILDLCGTDINYYRYVLQLMSCILPERYDKMEQVQENIRWLYNDDEIQEAQSKKTYDSNQCITYYDGGNTILRSHDGKLLIGIDHAALGFGAIAAHGHADALSFRMFVNGCDLFTDPGTYIYHADLSSRNEFRKTCNHNTLTVNGKDQSEMLGAFLWGRKSQCRLLLSEIDTDHALISAEHDGYAPMIHRRKYEFDMKDTLRIIDNVEGKKTDSNCELHFILGPDVTVQLDSNSAFLSCGDAKCHLQINPDDIIELKLTEGLYSPYYGCVVKTHRLSACIKGECVTTEIRILH
jgi:hypothetical protein